ncbi:MAG: hypothetical protein EU531_02325 [Promethearchaeota archaeon]|nr:MAG: hypothetical protein EU531_02325 [Candidatus Lokiarchaeota archaeon]
MEIVPAMKEEEMAISMFIDWDKYKNRFYNNLYLEDFKFVVKMPLIQNDKLDLDIKIKKFNLTEYTYLISYK